MKLKRAYTALAGVTSLMGAACYPGDFNCDVFPTPECIETVEVPGSRCDTGYYVNGECSYGEPPSNPGGGEYPPPEGGGGGPLGGGASADEGGSVSETTTPSGDTQLSFAEYKFKITIPKVTKDSLKDRKLNAIVKALKDYQRSPRLKEALDYINTQPQMDVLVYFSDQVQRGPDNAPTPFQPGEAGRIVTGTVNLYITVNIKYLGPGARTGESVAINDTSSAATRLATETVVHELIHPSVNGSRTPTREEESEVRKRTREAMRDLFVFGEFDDADPIEVQQTRARCAPIEQQCIIFLGQVHAACHVCSGEGLDYVRTCIAQTDASCLPVIPATEQIDMCLNSDPTQFPCLMFPPYPYDS
jgi:hypothetical protein